MSAKDPLKRVGDGKTHIFRGKTYVEAVAKAKTKLGKDISIVNRRDVKESNLFSKLTSGKLGGESLSVELEVAVTPPGEPETPKPVPMAPNPLLRTYAKAQEGLEKHTQAAREAMVAAAAPFASIGEASTGIAGQLSDLKKALEQSNRDNADMRNELRMIVSLQARGGMPAVGPELIGFYRRLTDLDVHENLARDVVETLQRDYPRLSGEKEILSALKQEIARRIPTAGPVLPAEGRSTVVALVGPSGVGKSTSVVKLAIHFSMRMRMSVGVVNEDIKRPGADGQINNLGRLFGISVITASEPKEMREVMESLAARDIILLDTGGRSPKDAKSIEKLGAILEAAKVDETHLLLASGSSEKTMLETVARFRPTGFDRIMLTKLDECMSYGGILNVAAKLSDGLSYITTGQDYGTPIQPADSLHLADLTLGLAEIAVESDENTRQDKSDSGRMRRLGSPDSLSDAAGI